MRRATVICAYTSDRWELLERAVDSVERQDIETELAIVIDHNDSLYERARERWPAHRVLANRFVPGLSGARNSGVAAVPAADVVAFLDDDAEAQPDWLRALTAPFVDPVVGLVGGHVEPDWAASPPEWFPSEFLWVVGCSYVGLPRHAGDVRNPIGASMAVRRRVFDEAGPFADGIGRIGRVPLGCEETELAIRAGRLGYRVRYEPASRVRHHVPETRTTVRYFMRRCFAEGVSKALVARSVGSRAALESERAYVTRTLPIGFGRNLAARRPGALARAGLIVAGCAATGTGYAVGRISRRQPHPSQHDVAASMAEEAA
jgi:GT2 family glycosyltransferase